MRNKIKYLVRFLPLIVNFIKYFLSKKKKPNKEDEPISYSKTNVFLSDHEEKIVFLDFGHGGIDTQGNYTTDGKLHDHGKGKFHNGSVFYEGVFNRIQTKKVAKKLIDKDIPFRFVAHPYKDTPLKDRVDYANDVAKKIGVSNTLYVSFHADAFNTHARGFSVYTSPGITRSDTIADALFKEVSNKMGHLITMRFDKSDGDYDKEARFYVLTQTFMPAILIEHLFFDNFEDAKMLMDEKIQELFAECTASVIEKWHKGLI